MTPYFRRINEVGSRFVVTDRQKEQTTTVTLRRMRRRLIIHKNDAHTMHMYTHTIIIPQE
jgi:hypothetical protein